MLKSFFCLRLAASGSFLEVIPCCGHIFQGEKPEETARIILKFLAAH